MRKLIIFLLMVFAILTSAVAQRQETKWQAVENDPFVTSQDIKISPNNITLSKDNEVGYNIFVGTPQNADVIYLQILTISETAIEIMNSDLLKYCIVAFKINNQWKLDTLAVSYGSCTFGYDQSSKVYYSSHFFVTPYTEQFLIRLSYATEIRVKAQWTDGYFEYPPFPTKGTYSAVQWLTNEKAKYFKQSPFVDSKQY